MTTRKKITDLLPRGAGDDELFIITLIPVNSFKVDGRDTKDLKELSAEEFGKFAKKILQENNQVLVTGNGVIYYGGDFPEEKE